MESEPRPPVVALVCSAGGLQALQRVLAPLPADFPASVLDLGGTVTYVLPVARSPDVSPS